MRRRRTVFLGVAVLFLIAAFCVWRAAGTTEGMEIYELSGGYIYNLEMSDILKKMKEEQTDAVFWTEKKDVLVFNPEFNRQITATVIGIAGDSYVLFPGQNMLGLGDEAGCLLGADAAVGLFGSTQVNGKRIEINGRAYTVAGILFEEKDKVLYGLSVKDLELLEYAGYRYKSKEEKNKKEHALESYFGIHEAMRR